MGENCHTQGSSFVLQCLLPRVIPTVCCPQGVHSDSRRFSPKKEVKGQESS